MVSGPRVALIGSRGIPARYGGFETLAEELAPRLAARGLRVTVYCRSHYTPRGLGRRAEADLVVLPTVRSKYLDTPLHTLLSCLHAAARRYDAALVVNAANALWLPLLQLAGIPAALHVDGLDRRRAKWGLPGRLVYALSERLAATLPEALITDAEVIRRYFRERLGADPTVLLYGVEPRPLPPGEVMARLGLESRRFFLYVSRFEPENNPHRVVEAYRQVGGELPLVMVGGAPYADRFGRRLRAAADPRVRFPGPVYGDGYRELLSHALAYVQATEVGGTHPALVEAMGYGNCLLVNDTPENREVAGEAAAYFEAARPETLGRRFAEVLRDPAVAARRGRQAGRRAAERFDWERVADGYARLLRSLAGGGVG